MPRRKQSISEPPKWIPALILVFFGLPALAFIALAIMFLSGGHSVPQQDNTQEVLQYKASEYNGERQQVCNHLMMNPSVAKATYEAGNGVVFVTVTLHAEYSSKQVRVLGERIRDYLVTAYPGPRSSIVGEVDIENPGGTVIRARVTTGVHNAYHNNWTFVPEAN